MRPVSDQIVKSTTKLKWERISPHSYNLKLLNPEDLNRRRIEELLDHIDREEHRKVQLKHEARTDLRRWVGRPVSPLDSSTYVLVSNWFLTGGGDRSSNLARLCEHLWDELFACRPAERLSSPAVGENHKIIPERFEAFYQDLMVAQSNPNGGTQEAPQALFESTADSNQDEYLYLARQIHLSTLFCAELADLLKKKKQIILEGPPGSGKTYVAEHLGRFLALGKEGYADWIENGLPAREPSQGRFDIIQFHESYGYEDFVQGFRPSVGPAGAMVFNREEGLFVEFCSRAKKEQNEYHVMVIDEINRGKLSKVFGELLYLLEYREKSIKLASGQPFLIPGNVLIIGTMNTADKSIALVDYALRRRFSFVPLHPVEDGQAPVLESWLNQKRIQNKSEVLRLFLNLNARIGREFSPDLQVGHSYFMDKELPQGSQFPEKNLQEIWKYNILPLVQEYAYTKSPDEIKEKFGLDAIRSYGG